MTKEEYTKERPLKVFTAFSGYDSQCMALDRLGVPYVLIGWSEIDKYAIQAHNAVYPEWADRNYGDISKIDWAQVPDFDLFTMSSPCQDFSNAGLQRGGDEGSGTRSSLLWECRKAILAKRPKYILFENVKALVSKKFLPSFRKWQDELASYGYSNFTKVLNARDFGIPQNRERIFMVSILDDNATYHFPEPFPLDRRLKDILEENVDERYYLSDKLVKGFMEHNRRHQEKGTGFLCRPKTGEDIANAVRANGAICPTDNMIAEPAVLTRKRNEYGKVVRKKYEAGELDESRHNMTDLVPREDGISNTITSVEKDNMLIVPFNTEKDGSARTITSHYSKTGIFNIMKGFGCGDTGVIRYGNIYGENMGSSMAGNVYDSEGISPSIMTCGGGNRNPLIIQKKRGKNKGGVHEICPTVSSNSFECNNAIIEVGNVNSSGRGMNGRVISDEGIATTLSTNKGEGFKILLSEKNFRMRKLTPREVFRLMDVSEENIDRIQKAGISRSQQYKMAGNSIVVSCLYHIFRKMFIDTGFEGMHKTLF